MKRFLALALSLLMILGVLLMAGCDTDTSKNTTGSSNKPSGTSSSSSSSSSTTSSSEDDKPVQPTGKEKMPGYEDVDFGGATFTIVGADGESDGFNSAKEIYSEESDAISVAVRERNQWIESLYNCTIKGVASPTPASDAMTEVTSNLHTIDLYTHHYSIDGTAKDGKVYNLFDLGSRDIDFSKPWWDQKFVDTYTVKKTNGTETLYSIVGDFALTTFDCTHALVYNKTVFQNDSDVNHLNLYQLVRDKKWTMDQFQFIVKNVVNDADGNSTIDSQTGDVAGWIRTSHASHGMHVASGLPIMKNTDGVFTFEVDKNTESWTNVVNKAAEIWAMPEGQTISYSVIPETLAGGFACFASEILGSALVNLADFDAEIGILPYPLYSETQENYAHYVDNHVYVYSVPTSVSEIEAMGDFLAIYAYHSTYLVRPVYISVYAYDYCSDEESAEMLGIILDTMTYDAGYLCNGGSLESDITNMIQTNNNQIAQFAAKRAATANTWISNYVAGIDDNND